MEEINIKQDIEQFIHDVLTDADTKSNPELIAAVTGLLNTSIGFSSNEYKNIEFNVEPNPDVFL